MSHEPMLERWDEDEKIYLGVHIKKRMFPAMLGGIVGDALGVPVEFRPRNLNVTDMIGYGTYNQPPGTWSDDTSMTMCLIENLIEQGSISDLMQKFADYRDKGYWTPYGEMFDIGITTVTSIERFQKGTAPEKCGGDSEFDNGNGALMRIAPLVFVLFHEFNFQRKLSAVEKYAALTHRHPRSTLGCIFYVELLIRLFHNSPFEEAYDEAVASCKDYLAGTTYEKEFPAYQRIFTKEILHVDKGEVKSDGYVVHSLEAALWCLAKHDNYRDTVLEAVNLGGDTDTIALIAGTLAGMHYMEGIPEEWVDQLARKEDILDACQRFLEHCTDIAFKRRNTQS